MDPAVFGPGTWGLLFSAAWAVHSCASHELWDTVGAACALFDAMRAGIGCDPCRLTYVHYSAAHPLTVRGVHAAEMSARAARPSTPLTRYFLVQWVHSLHCAVQNKLGREVLQSFERILRRVAVYRGGLGGVEDALGTLTMFALRACAAKQHRSKRSAACLAMLHATCALALVLPSWGRGLQEATAAAVRDAGGGGAARASPSAVVALLLCARQHLRSARGQRGAPQDDLTAALKGFGPLNAFTP